MASAFMVVNDAFLDSILLRKLGILRSISTLPFAFPRQKVRLSLREMSTFVRSGVNETSFLQDIQRKKNIKKVKNSGKKKV